MKIQTIPQVNNLDIDNSVRLNRFFKSFKTKTPVVYNVYLNKERPKLLHQYEVLSMEERKDFIEKFASTVVNLDPTVKKTVTNQLPKNLNKGTRNMFVGGVAGGAAGAGTALTILSIREMSKLLNNPVLFAIGVTAMGVVGGALSGKVLNYFSRPPDRNIERRLEVSANTPQWWNVFFPTLQVQMNFGTKPPKG